jgi:hypothetical protein
VKHDVSSEGRGIPELLSHITKSKLQSLDRENQQDLKTERDPVSETLFSTYSEVPTMEKLYKICDSDCGNLSECTYFSIFKHDNKNSHEMSSKKGSVVISSSVLSSTWWRPKAATCDTVIFQKISCAQPTYYKIKAISITGRGGLWVCDILWVPYCLDSRLKDCGEVVILTHRSCPMSKKYFLLLFLVHILLEAE